MSLIGVDMGHTTSKVAIRFANILRNLIPSSDIGVMEMTASAMGKLALASSTITAEYVEYEAKRAFEWLSGDRHEGRRHAAVSNALSYFCHNTLNNSTAIIIITNNLKNVQVR